MNKKGLRLWAFILCVITILPTISAISYANSAQTWWGGVDATGTIVTDEQCPVVVEKEVLTFDIEDLPKTYYESKEEYAAYQATVRAEYSLYNPSEYAVTVHLLFPFGALPDYRNYYDEEDGTFVGEGIDTDYEITLNGEAISKKVRHTLCYYYREFDLDTDLAMLTDGYIEDDFYSPNLKVTKYVYEISGVNSEKYSAASIGMDYTKDELNGTSKMWLVGLSGFTTLNDDHYRVHTWANNGQQITLYVIGEAFEKLPDWTFYENGGVNDREKIRGKCELISTTTMTFEELAMSEYKQESGIEKSDWYNAVVTALNDNEEVSGLISWWKENLDVSEHLMRWYEYEITLEAGQRAVNAVTAPMYPMIDARYIPDIYQYTYLLSPAKTWKEFGTIEVIVNTPYYMIDSSIKGFTELEGGNGYRMELSELPEEELKFTLATEKEVAEKNYNSKFGPERNIRAWLIAGAGMLFVLGGIVVVWRYRSKKC